MPVRGPPLLRHIGQCGYRSHSVHGMRIMCRCMSKRRHPNGAKGYHSHCKGFVVGGQEMLQRSESEFLEVILDDDASRAMTRNGIEIRIDRRKCIYSMYDPKGCKKCLQVCPVRVYATRPLEKRDFSVPPKDRVDPTQWIILPTWADWCNGCGTCVDECPKDAITINFGGKLLGSETQ